VSARLDRHFGRPRDLLLTEQAAETAGLDREAELARWRRFELESDVLLASEGKGA
jgi:hypothetical protein